MMRAVWAAITQTFVRPERLLFAAASILAGRLMLRPPLRRTLATLPATIAGPESTLAHVVPLMLVLGISASLVAIPIGVAASTSKPPRVPLLQRIGESWAYCLATLTTVLGISLTTALQLLTLWLVLRWSLLGSLPQTASAGSILLLAVSALVGSTQLLALFWTLAHVSRTTADVDDPLLGLRILGQGLTAVTSTPWRTLAAVVTVATLTSPLWVTAVTLELMAPAPGRHTATHLTVTLVQTTCWATTLACWARGLAAALPLGGAKRRSG